MENTEPFVRIAQRKREKVNKSNFFKVYVIMLLIKHKEVSII